MAWLSPRGDSRDKAAAPHPKNGTCWSEFRAEFNQIIRPEGRRLIPEYFQSLPLRLASPTLARPSRPPGFDMTYRPTARVFLPPWRSRLPSLLYLGLTLVVAGIVFVAEHSPTNSVLYVQLIEKGSRRLITPRTFALLLLFSSISSVLRTNMRGVRLRGDGIEYRDLVSLVIPKLRRLRWAQMNRISLSKTGLYTIDLWDGTRVYMPRVQDSDLLAKTLEHVALARAIPLEGGTGLDDVPEADDLPEHTAS